jgi:hypothetical protein
MHTSLSLHFIDVRCLDMFRALLAHPQEARTGCLKTCPKLFLGIPHPHLSKKVPINMGPNVNRFRDIDLRPCAGIEYYIRCSKC